MVAMDSKAPLIEAPPCQMACPIATEAREYIQRIAERKFESALAAIKKQNPLPGVCGRICTHPCENACKRGKIEQPVAIAALKRFAADGPWGAQVKTPLQEKRTGHKVAVVGSGPAGIAAAHDLALLGHHVTIFEALPALGGMLRVGVPAYRLPKNVLDEEIKETLDLGVEARTGVRVGEDIGLADLVHDGYEAVFLAIGAHTDRKLGVPGEETFDGVVSAVSLLRATNQGKKPEVGRRAAVVGGGNTAIDSARSLLRLGCESAHLLYRRSQDEMPASREEVRAAMDEGVDIAYLTSPVEITGTKGRVSGLKCVKNTLGEPDASGRRTPEAIPGSDFVLDVDMVVAAIGQAPDSFHLSNEPGFSDRGGRICVQDPDSLATAHPGIFAGGDGVTGPATAVKAIAAGKQAAISIDCYLNGQTSTEKASTCEHKPVELGLSIVDRTKKFPRAEKKCLAKKERLTGFDEVESVFSEDAAVREALRCLHCYLGAKVDQEKCIACLTCVRVCPLGIPTFGKMGEIAIDPVSCQACGMCVVECPVRAIDIGFHPRDRISSELKALVGISAVSMPKIVGFFDLYGNFTRSDMENLKQAFPNILPVMVFGLRRIDVADILTAFACGADGVLLAECPQAMDPFPESSKMVRARLAHARALLAALGLNEGHLDIGPMPERGMVDSQWLGQFVEKVKGSGRA